MRLVPTHPPGRSTRKARDFETEIGELHAQGYTLEAIREALAGAGVQVGISTVRREANRHAAPRPVSAPASAAVAVALAPAPSRTPLATEAPTALVYPSTRLERRSGKDVAEAFMRNRITNPLVRSEEHP